MTGRPLMLLVAVLVLAIEGVGAVGFAIFLAVLAGGLLGEIQPFGALLPASSIAFGVAAFVAAIAAWRRRSWSWVVAAAIQAILLLGVIVASLSGGFHPALAAAVALGGLGLVALLSEDTRRALGV